jgi:glycosyltransferase involved in cell wall biosynthesis
MSNVKPARLSVGQTFLSALKKIKKLFPFDIISITVIAGFYDQRKLEREIKEIGLEKKFRLYGIVSYKESLILMKQSHILLLVNPPEEKGKRHLHQKAYNYLAANKPILALSSEGVTSDLLKEAGAGIVCDPNDHECIEKSIIKIYNDYLNGTFLYNIDRSKIMKYERKELTKNWPLF